MEDSSLIEASLHEFLGRLSSDAPTPGGGSVAALAGALGASLGRMVCALTLGRKKFTEVEEQVQQISGRLARSEMMLESLVEEDASAYGELDAAFKIDKAEPGRKQKIEQAAGLAAAVPLESVAISRQVFVDLGRLKSIGNPNLASDVEAGMHMARAAMLAAAANVRVNLPFLPEEQSVKVEGELARLLEIDG